MAMRKGEIVLGIVGVALVVIALLVKNSDSGDASAGLDQRIETEQILADLTDSEPVPFEQPVASGLDVAPGLDIAPSPQLPAPPVASSAGVKEKPVAQSTKAADRSAPGDRSVFSYRARLVDRNGKVVVQLRPSILSPNIETLSVGVVVHAASKTDRWVLIRIADGRIGFVKLRQLKFQ